MAKRLCQYCEDPMPWWSKLLHIYTCKNCAYRMSMGTSPRRRTSDTTDEGK